MNACIPYAGRFLASSDSPQQLSIYPSTHRSVAVMPRSGQWRFAQACRAYEAAAQFNSIAQLDLTTAPPNADHQPRDIRATGDVDGTRASATA
jgi:hypothetical protein